MSATSVTTVIRGDTRTAADRPQTSWHGFIHVEVFDRGYSTALDLYVAEDHARILAEQLLAALAEPAPVAVTP